MRHDDAARAIAKLSGHGYDHLILHLEWAKYVKRGKREEREGRGEERRGGERGERGGGEEGRGGRGGVAECVEWIEWSQRRDQYNILIFFSLLFCPSFLLFLLFLPLFLASLQTLEMRLSVIMNKCNALKSDSYSHFNNKTILTILPWLRGQGGRGEERGEGRRREGEGSRSLV